VGLDCNVAVGMVADLVADPRPSDRRKASTAAGSNFEPASRRISATAFAIGEGATVVTILFRVMRCAC
jgi:hypothetical protein